MVETAAGVVEEVGRRVVGTASSVLEKAGVDLAGVERRLGGQFPPSVETLQTLAGEAVTAGRAGVDLAVGVARTEAEKVFEKVGDQVTKVGVVLAYLETKLREVEEEAPAAASGPGPDEPEEPVPAPRAADLFGRGWEFEEERSAAGTPGEPIVAERVEVDEPVEFDPPVPPVPPAAGAARAPQEQPAAPEDDAAGKSAEPKSTARKSTEPKSTAKKSEPGQTAAKKSAARKAPAKRTPTTKGSTAEKAAAKKTTTVRKTAAAQAEAQPGTPVKRAASRKTTVRKATSAKKSDARDE
ncbi:hypothetical protein [Kitasatospora sp. NPDC001547]|uniref:hypothetical protein n=1 Tax=Kitasatospora sp. NPDC001547 TaxID=3364015 RepID=UPI0036785957